MFNYHQRKNVSATLLWNSSFLFCIYFYIFNIKVNLTVRLINAVPKFGANSIFKIHKIAFQKKLNKFKIKLISK